MIAAPVHLAGARLLLDPAGALVWPEAGMLVVSDLHLEKGSAGAAGGRLLPPWDTKVTLDRLALLLRRWQPCTVVALGDSFHDRRAAHRLPAPEQARLRAMTGAARFLWVLGNHDPEPPEGLGGEAVSSFAEGSLVFRHEARGRAAAGLGELCGHCHPKASIATRAGQITRPCFVADDRRIMLPAFGAYTGGLDVRHAAIAGLFPRGGRAFLLGQSRLFSFSLNAPASARPPAGQAGADAPAWEGGG